MKRPKPRGGSPADVTVSRDSGISPQLSWISRAEWLVAILFTLVAVAIHVVNLRAAGGLWRDEAAAVRLATMPSFGEIWAHLEHESFPLLITLLLRSWAAVGFGSGDLALRSFGLLVGIAVIAAIWWSVFRLSSRPPLIALLLLGLSPTVIRWGDSLRAYGVGVVFVLLAFAAVWALVQSQSWRTLLLAIVTSVLAVQALYQNAFVLAAICAAGSTAAAWRRDWKAVGCIVGVGGIAALTLLPYRGVVARANEWNAATQVPIDFSRIWLVLHRALNDRGPVVLWLWGALICAAIIAAAVCMFRRQQDRGDDADRHAACFLLTAGAVAVTAYYVFLKALKFPTEVWYYLVGIAIVAVAADALLSRALRNRWLRGIRLLTVVIAAAMTVHATFEAVRVRMTNLDLVAQRLNAEAAEGDLIIVHPWFCAATLRRYHTGNAELMTLPPLADMRLQRLDLLKEQMKLEEPIQPVLANIETTLRAGRNVWLVGYFPFADPPRRPPKLPPAGQGPEGWRAAPYMTVYGMEVAYFLQYHITGSPAVEVPTDLPVNPFENFPLRRVYGWRP